MMWMRKRRRMAEDDDDYDSEMRGEIRHTKNDRNTYNFQCDW